MAETRRLFWDCSHIASHPGENTGIERVVRQLGAALAEAAPGFGLELVPCVTDGSSRIERLPAIPAVGDRPFERGGPAAEPGSGDIWMLADNVLDTARLVGISPWWREGMRIVLLQHDLVPIRHPELTTPITANLFARWMSEAVALADAFVSVSGATAAALGDTIATLAPWRDITPAELPVVHLASTWHPATGAPAPAPGQPWRLVAVGTVEPRKRFDLLLDAFEDHWRAGGRTGLTLVGKEGWNTASLQKRLARLADSEPRLTWLRSASDAELEAEYLQAGAFVSVSSEEGFGLPVVEAAAAGLPLILSDIPVFREITGGQARYVGSSPVECRRDLTRLLDDLDAGRETLVPPAPELAGRTWSDAAAELLTALDALPAPSRELRHRWDHRAALALAGGYGRAPAAGPSSPGTAVPAPTATPAEAPALRLRLSERYSQLRLRAPLAVVRIMQIRNQLFRLCQQLDARTSAIETRVAALAKVHPTANALQQIRAAEADQTLRFQLDAILGDIDDLISGISPPAGDDGDLAAGRERVAALRRRLRARRHA